MTFEELCKIGDCFISFESILEPRIDDVNLRIIVNKSNDPIDLLIFPHSDSKVETLQIDFKNYVTYSVIYDDYTIRDKNETFRGDTFRIYDKSNYIDFVQRESSLKGRNFTHYSLACIEHKIDIISRHSPYVKKIDSGLNK